MSSDDGVQGQLGALTVLLVVLHGVFVNGERRQRVVRCLPGRRCRGCGSVRVVQSLSHGTRRCGTLKRVSGYCPEQCLSS